MERIFGLRQEQRFLTLHIRLLIFRQGLPQSSMRLQGQLITLCLADLSTSYPIHCLLTKLDSRTNFAGPSLQNLLPMLRYDGYHFASLLAKPSCSSCIVQVGMVSLRQAHDVDGVHSIEVNASSQAFKPDKNGGDGLSCLFPLFHLLPGRASHRLIQRLCGSCSLLEQLMSFSDFICMILLIVSILYGPAAGPVLRICPQGLMNCLDLMKAPVM
mmetsp:Transcript_10872/g.26046  ORF Transcript_10872/g.26046 Transcript_10872/m.26046 type:complete len:214 (-) Transcript_10872:1809-2450(-)